MVRSAENFIYTSSLYVTPQRESMGGKIMRMESTSGVLPGLETNHHSSENTVKLTLKHAA
ncbi:hypothetical protein AOR02nite_06220 [Acetobacter orientalis]|uniref:Uncharacterized protein n=2 Tax=Acetobacter orientalis TaxID=146474 RepID=A0A0D6NL25_9PROT|nr:hypothetical protein Abor_024_226 [Acetobacter orientalis]GEL60780.1 hypothetical protein AOR02nite_06220 [Acetobacter orientalis]